MRIALVRGLCLVLFILGLQPVVSMATVNNAYKVDSDGADKERVFLNGTYVQAGISINGRFGTGSNAPPSIAGVTWRTSAGLTGLGFVGDRTRDGNWWDTDFFMPGTQLEGWAYTADGSTQIFNHNTNASAAAATFTFSDVEVTSSLAKVTHTTVKGDFTISHIYKVARGSGTFENDQKLMMDVTVTNNGGSTVSSFDYLRHVDPDNLQTVDGVYRTDNTVVAQYGVSGKSYSLVKATKADTGAGRPGGTSYLGLFSSDPRSKVAHGGFHIQDPVTVHTTESLEYKTTPGETRVNEDKAISIVFQLGAIASGESKTFSLAYVLSETAAAEAVAAAEAPAKPQPVSPRVLVPSSLLTFAPNGADNTAWPQSEIKGTVTKLRPNTLTRSGFVFNGWNTSANGSGSSYTDGAEFKFDSDSPILYAQWLPIKSTPVITWSNPAVITTTTALSATQLNASANVPGSCAYSPALGVLLTAGKQTLTCTFTPTDSTKYSVATKSVEIEVLASPVITWSNPASIRSGTALSATQLNATANTPGTFEYSPALGVILKAGKAKLLVTLTPTDTRLAKVTKEVEIEVTPANTPSADAITTISGASASGAIKSTTTEASTAIKSLGNGIDKASATGSSLTVTAKAGYSGKTTVTISVTDEARTLDLVVPVTVLPAATSAANYALNSLASTSITWSAASGATGYVVTIDGRAGCTVTATSCQVSMPAGPANKVEVVSQGADNTASGAKLASYQSPATPIVAATVNFATAKSDLTKAGRAKLDEFASFVKQTGLTTLQIQGHTDSVGGVDNQRLSNARAKSTLRYLRSVLPGVSIKVVGFGDSRPAVPNEDDAGKAQNRRAEVLIP